MTLAEELDQIMKSKRSVYVRLATRLVGPEDAEDVVQDALIRAFTKLDQFKGEAALSTWLGSIVLNTARMQFRKKFRYVDSHTVLLDEETWKTFEADSVDPVEKIDWERKYMKASNAIRRLPNCYHEPLTLRMEGWLIKDIAKHLNISAGTVKAYCHRTKIRLARECAWL